MTGMAVQCFAFPPVESMYEMFSSRPSGRPGSASPFRRPDPPGTRRGGGSASGGAAAAADGMKTPAKGTGVLRSPKVC